MGPGFLRRARTVRTLCGCQWHCTEQRGCFWWASLVRRRDDEAYLLMFLVAPLLCALIALLADPTTVIGVLLFSGATAAIVVSAAHGCMRLWLAARVLLFVSVLAVVDRGRSGRAVAWIAKVAPAMVARATARPRSRFAEAGDGASPASAADSARHYGLVDVNWRRRSVVESAARGVFREMWRPLAVFFGVAVVLIGFFLPSHLDSLVQLLRTLHSCCSSCDWNPCLCDLQGFVLGVLCASIYGAYYSCTHSRRWCKQVLVQHLLLGGGGGKWNVYLLQASRWSKERRRALRYRAAWGFIWLGIVVVFVVALSWSSDVGKARCARVCTALLRV